MTEIQIGTKAKARVSRDDEWVVLYVEDGSGAATTVSLTPLMALDLHKLLQGAAIKASGLRR